MLIRSALTVAFGSISLIRGLEMDVQNLVQSSLLREHSQPTSSANCGQYGFPLIWYCLDNIPVTACSPYNFHKLCQQRHQLIASYTRSRQDRFPTGINTMYREHILGKVNSNPCNWFGHEIPVNNSGNLLHGYPFQYTSNGE
jgi:hypothetical protein